MSAPVIVERRPVAIPTYSPMPADRHPMFLEKRVYQGSSGKVYPLPFVDRISQEKKERSWDAVHLENEFIRVMILPELGGRIHVGQDKTNDYDFFYRQEVIKPALVGLAGPWISGGVEFNWPQHHRPATYMPVDVEIERASDGSVTVWLSDHDPMTRMKGMHGVCLYPDRAYIELKVRAYNRTAHVQTFLWWANVAARVHESYQSFFPTDVYYVADHAKRAMSRFPKCDGHYYGVDYGKRADKGVPKQEMPMQFVPPGDYPPNDLSWYANIPVPTSYMCMESNDDFFGGYDHKEEAGFVHVANHHISPGKKQWTWGNHDFGYAWDRNLTEPDANGEYAPYIELMAGVYTDNQPDFSYLMPGETKTWSQYWYPIQKIGPVHQANLDAAVHLSVEKNTVRLGIAVTRAQTSLKIELSEASRVIKQWEVNLKPGQPFTTLVKRTKTPDANKLSMRVVDSMGRVLLTHHQPVAKNGKVPEPATEPALPRDISSTDELYITGVHLEQYRHATRMPEHYWREALRRDPGDSRCHLALGKWHLKRGEWCEAEEHLRASIKRLTLRNPNPYDGEAHYQLGQVLRFQADAMGFAETSDQEKKSRHDLLSESYTCFYKATWNQAWQSSAYHCLAELDCCQKNWIQAREHIERSLRANTENLRARNLYAMVLKKLGAESDVSALIHETLKIDPLDWWGRYLRGDELTCDTQVRLDLAIDLLRAGFNEEADTVLTQATLLESSGNGPMVYYYRAWIAGKRGKIKAQAVQWSKASKESPDYCFPSRLEDIIVLQSAQRAVVNDARAPYYLGNLFYDRRRFEEAITCWEISAKRDPKFSIVWRNLGIGYFNIHQDGEKAARSYERAFRLDSGNARLLFERDQLWKRLGVSPESRLAELQTHLNLVMERDDLTVELGALYNQTRQPEKAAELLSERIFQPWEGGEGLVLGQFVRTQLALGKNALEKGEHKQAIALIEEALRPPRNLGEARHPLANQSDVHYWLGCALEAGGDVAEARIHWKIAADFRGDFQQMSVRSYSEMTYYSAMSLSKLGNQTAAQKLLRKLMDYAVNFAKHETKIDYFATSLPTMLLFDEDLQQRQLITALFMQAQAYLGLHDGSKAKRLLRKVLKLDPNHPAAADLLNETP